MKLWLILYAGSQIGGSWGPLPYGVDECRERAAEMNTETRAIGETGKNSHGEILPEKNVMQIRTFRFVCEFRDIRPKNTYGGRKGAQL